MGRGRIKKNNLHLLSKVNLLSCFGNLYHIKCCLWQELISYSFGGLVSILKLEKLGARREKKKRKKSSFNLNEIF